MSKKIPMLLSILSAVMIGFIVWAPAAVAEHGYAWVLAEVIQEDAADKIAGYNSSSNSIPPIPCGPFMFTSTDSA